MECKND